MSGTSADDNIYYNSPSIWMCLIGHKVLFHLTVLGTVCTEHCLLPIASMKLCILWPSGQTWPLDRVNGVYIFGHSNTQGLGSVAIGM